MHPLRNTMETRFAEENKKDNFFLVFTSSLFTPHEAGVSGVLISNLRKMAINLKRNPHYGFFKLPLWGKRKEEQEAKEISDSLSINKKWNSFG